MVLVVSVLFGFVDCRLLRGGAEATFFSHVTVLYWQEEHPPSTTACHAPTFHSKVVIGFVGFSGDGGGGSPGGVVG
jgi:hypothetical protein